MSEIDHGLRELASLFGVTTEYHDVFGTRRVARREALLAVLAARGAEIERAEDCPSAIEAARRAHAAPGLPTVAVAWRGEPAGLRFRVPSRALGGAFSLTGAPEDGSGWEVQGRLEAASPPAAGPSGDTVQVAVALPDDLPLGRHTLRVDAGAGPGASEGTLLVAPVVGCTAAAGRRWGVFAPLYGLWSRRRPAAGDVSTLETLLDWATGLGASVIGTLPLLDAFLSERPFEPSPYAPASRLFYNELYVDLARAPELSGCPEAAARLEALERDRAPHDAATVDFRALHDARRPILAQLADRFFASPGARTRLEALEARRPMLVDWARFRAYGEQTGEPWPCWADAPRDGRLDAVEVDEARVRAHLYAQLLADEQMEALARRAAARDAGLYLDLPLGVHPDGYDRYRHRAAFADGVSAGAPPDTFFVRGQDWGFAPPHPEGQRADGYAYLAACVRHHVAHARVLRVDHVMGLHRLFWVPRGFEPVDGMYVDHPAHELYAVLSLEAHRHGCELVGEDLGTVPDGVRPAMGRHGLSRMHVLQFDARPDVDAALSEPPAESVASLNTHDMPPFAAFARALDVDDRVALGLLGVAQAEAERAQRAATVAALREHLRRRGLLEDGADDDHALLAACERALARGPAHLVLVSLEDLWLEARPQNVPGTHRERDNFCRKLARPLDDVVSDPSLSSLLRVIDSDRRA